MQQNGIGVPGTQLCVKGENIRMKESVVSSSVDFIHKVYIN